MTITRVLAGGGVPGSLRVYSVLLGHMPPGDALYLLRAMPDGLYETVGFRDGSLPVHGGRVERWGLTLDQIRLKVRDVRAASSRRKP